MFRAAYQFHLDQLPLLRAAAGLSWSQGLDGPLGHRPSYGAAIAAITGLLNRGRERGELASRIDTALIAEMLWEGYLANYRRAVFDHWGLEQLLTHLAQQIEVLIAGAEASASPA